MALFYQPLVNYCEALTSSITLQNHGGAYPISAKPGFTSFSLLAVSILVGLVLMLSSGNALAEEPNRYLAFQIFLTSADDQEELRHHFPPPPPSLHEAILDLRDRIGTAKVDNRHIGFILGPLAFDNADAQVRERIASGFEIALETGVAVGFHLDDSMFWSRLNELNTPAALEWLDWQGTPNTGRRLNWSPPNPTKIAPQLCINSKIVEGAVRTRAALIGNEIANGIQKLRAAGKDDLFLGVIAGWETEIGKDFRTGKQLGYCALSNAGYNEQHRPTDRDSALSKIVQDYIELWARPLINAGVPNGKVYSHIALMSGKSPSSAFCASCIPGVSTYPFPGLLKAWLNEIENRGNPPWASSEGTAMDPREAERSGQGIGMEGYLGNLFNHGAVLVNVFGWGIGDDNNPFRKIAESVDAISAYRKFLRGEKLAEAPIPDALSMLPATLRTKIMEVQAKLPGWLQQRGPALVHDQIENLKQSVEEQRFDDAEKAADSILKTMGK
jgi:hypothetical protein